MAKSENVGMKPRVSGGRTTNDKVNTCGNSSRGKRLGRQLAGIEEHLGRHPKCSASQLRVSTINTLLKA